MSLLGLFGLIMGYFNEPDITFLDYLFVLVIPFVVSFVLLMLLLAKKGVLIIKNKIYKTQYIFGKILSKKEIELMDITDISILKYSGRQKYNFFSAAKPDLSYTIENNKIYLLNERHTIKNFIISTENKELAEKTVEIIKNHFNLNFKLYSPRF
jgi:hypothetical protein